MVESIVLKGLHDIVETQHQLEWQFFREGIEIYPLYYHLDNKPAAALLRYQAGAEVPRHNHPGYEHILVLSGNQQDDNDVYEEGTLLISQPGSQHAVRSESGCIVLAFWQATVEFVE